MSFTRKNRKDSSPEDLELIRMYKATGEKELIGELWIRYSHRVLGTCIKYLRDKDDAKDAVADIFVELMQKLTTHEVTHFNSWLYRLSTNHCLMKLRKKGPEPSRLDNSEYKGGEFMENPSPEHLMGDEVSEEELLHKALGQLKTEQRICVEFFYLKKMTYKEIMEKTNFDIKKVKSYIQNGMRNLKIILKRGTNL